MRQPQRNNNNNRSRGRGRNHNNNNKSSNPLSRNYESNGPDVKIRGNAAHIAEKYSVLARDAQSSGDSVMAEGYYQHAEHYNRLVATATLAQEEKRAADVAYRAQQESQRAERNAQNVAANADALEVKSEKEEVAAEVTLEVASNNNEASEQPPVGRSRTQRTSRTRRPRKEPKAEVKADAESDAATSSAKTAKVKTEKLDEGISKDAAGLPEGLLGSSTATRETAGADE